MSGKSKERPEGVRGGYTIAKGERICELIAEGSGLRKAAAAVGVKYRTARSWVERYPRFGTAFARACEVRLALLEDELLEELEEAGEAAYDREFGRGRLEAARLKIDTLKWLLGKLAARRFGDRTQMELTGRDGADLLPKHTREEDAAFAALVAAAQTRTPRRADYGDVCSKSGDA